MTAWIKNNYKVLLVTVVSWIGFIVVGILYLLGKRTDRIQLQAEISYFKTQHKIEAKQKTYDALRFQNSKDAKKLEKLKANLAKLNTSPKADFELSDKELLKKINKLL